MAGVRAWTGEQVAALRQYFGLTQAELAKGLGELAVRMGEPAVTHTQTVSRWERGVRGPTKFYSRLLTTYFEQAARELGGDLESIIEEAFMKRRRFLRAMVGAVAVPLFSEQNETHIETSFNINGTGTLLERFYRLDGEFGGNDVLPLVTAHVQTATAYLHSVPLKRDAQRRFLGALGQLTQMAGWLSIDANRHADASRYLVNTVHAGHETDNLSLAGHALGYMSLSAFYRDEPEKALALAEAGLNLARANGRQHTLASLHNRAARAHARLGHENECKRHLDLAYACYTADRDTTSRPPWIEYVTESEMAAQRGACFLDLGQSSAAIGSLDDAIHHVQTSTPDHKRDLAHYQIRLAYAHLLQGELEQAVEVGRDAYRLATQIASARVDERFAELIGRFDQHGSADARALVDEVRVEGLTSKNR